MVNVNQPSASPLSTPKNSPQPVQTYENSSPKLEQVPNYTSSKRYWHLFKFYIIKAVAILLVLQGLWSLFISLKFIFFDLPSLEKLLAAGQITSTQINFFANEAIVMILSTIMSLFFGLRITLVQSKFAKIVNTFIAILLVLGNTQINNFLNQLDSTHLLTSAILEALRSIPTF